MQEILEEAFLLHIKNNIYNLRQSNNNHFLFSDKNNKINLSEHYKKEDKKMLEKDFKELVNIIKNDIYTTRYKAQTFANNELIALYYRIGKYVYENSKYGSSLVDNLSTSLKLVFPNTDGFSSRNILRMKKFYEEYQDVEISPLPMAKLTWTHNNILISRIKDNKKRLWYAEKTLENGWACSVLETQIDTDLYSRQKNSEKLTNFENKLPSPQSELAKDTIKDPYIFELQGIKDDSIETDIENAMVERIKNILLELGKGFSFLENQYKVSTEKNDYYIDLLFYHLDLRCFIAVELKNKEFKSEFMGQLSFYVTAVDETLKKDADNPSIGLLLCRNKDKLSVEWALKGTNAPTRVSSFEITKLIPKEILDKLPTEEDINLHIDLDKK